MMRVVYPHRFPKMGHLHSSVTHNGHDSTAIYYIGSYLEGLAINIRNYSLFGNRLFWALLEDK